MRRLGFSIWCLVFGVSLASAQPASFSVSGDPSTFEPVPSISSNTITNLHVQGDSLWVGPRFSLTTNSGASWQQAVVDSVSNGRGRVFSIDVEGDVIWAGLGFDQRTDGAGGVDFVPTTLGFAVSEDGGRSWQYRFPPLDTQADSVVQYGVTLLPALPVVVPQQSPPWDIDYDPVNDQLWSAGWASGLRRSSDGGLTWQRMVLPPDSVDEIRPDRFYNFIYTPRQEQGLESQTFNFSSFAVLIDEEGTAWAGSAGGFNRSLNPEVEFPTWRRFEHTGTPDGLIGNWIISIEEQPLPGRNPVWATNWPANGDTEQFGAIVTRDGGETIEQVLIGEKLYDFAFDGETVYAAGDSGVFISSDGGLTWRTASYFGPDTRPDIIAFSVAVTPGGVWAGTNDGLFRSTDGGFNWTAIRADVSLSDGPDGEAVEAYAYPNPFSPATDGLTRFRFESNDGSATLRILDFNMNLVREVTRSGGAGVQEFSWNGIDDRGAQVANGVYFYSIESGGDRFWGKLLVIE